MNWLSYHTISRVRGEGRGERNLGKKEERGGKKERAGEETAFVPSGMWRKKEEVQKRTGGREKKGEGEGDTSFSTLFDWEGQGEKKRRKRTDSVF